MQTHLHADFLSPVGRLVFLLPGTGERKRNTFTRGNLCPAFRQIEGGQRARCIYGFSIASAQDHLYAKVAYFRVAYYEPLHVTSQFELDAFQLLNRHKGLVATIQDSADLDVLGVPHRAASPSANETQDLY